MDGDIIGLYGLIAGLYALWGELRARVRALERQVMRNGRSNV